MIDGLELGIVTANGASLASFYEAAFGFSVDRVLDFPQGVVRRLSSGPALLKIFEPADAPAAAPATEMWNRVSGVAYGALHVSDAAAAVTTAKTAGASVLTDVTQHRPGASFALLADPEGNVWEILEDHGHGQHDD